MVRRSARILFEVVAAILAGIVILAALAAWRLSQDRPIHLRFLTPYLEQALNPSDGSFRLEIGETVLTWAGWEHALEVRARRVEAFGADGGRLAAVPELAVSLSARALWRGLVAPTSIDIFRPRIFVRREPGGRFLFMRPDATALDRPSEETSPLLPALLGELLSPPERGRATGYFDRARIVDGSIVFEDRVSGVTWRVPRAGIALRRGAAGIVGTLALELEGLGRPASVEATYDFDPAPGRVAVEGTVAGVDMAALGLIEPSLAMLAGSDLVLGGKFATSVGLDGQIGATTFEVAGGAGTIAMPEMLEGPLAVAGMTLAGRLEAGLDRFQLDRAAIDFGGPSLELDLTASGLLSAARPEGGLLNLAARATLRDVPLGELGRYWPLISPGNARRWATENIIAGTLREVAFDLDLGLPAGRLAEAEVRKADIALTADGLTIHYFRPLPPIEGAAATARVNATDFVAEFTGGAAGGIELEKGRVAISRLDRPDQRYDIEVTIAGALADVLGLIDREPFGFAGSLGLALEPGAVSGSTMSELALAFPNVPKRGTRLEDLEVQAHSRLSQVRLAKAFFGQDLSEGELELRLDGKGMTVDGTARVADMPAKIDWVERFGAGPFKSRIALSGTAEARHRAALGFDLSPYLEGPLPLDLAYTRYDDRRAGLVGSADLAAAGLEIPFLAWKKAPGVPGEARVELDLVDGQATQLRAIEVSAGDFRTSGRGRFAPDGAIAGLELDSLKFGRSALEGVTADFAAGFVRVTVAGGELDAEPLMADDEDEPAASDEPKQPFSLRADRLARVHIGPGRQLEDVSLALRHDGLWWDRIGVEAKLAGGGSLAVNYQPSAAGTHALAVESDDAGAVLKAFDIVGSVEGGKLSIVGEANDGAPDRPLKGRALIEDFRLVRAPAMARLLSIAMLTGLVDAFTGEGFLFTRFTGNFVKTGGRLEVPKARAFGPSIGITATGDVDFDADKVDLKGTIVPAYAINSILGNIPIIGNLLQGGEGEGLFAATYSASGPIDEPRIVVNPLAAFAPGFLREIFEGAGEGSDNYTPLPRAREK